MEDADTDSTRADFGYDDILAVNAALGRTGVRPVGALGAARWGRSDPRGASHDVHSVTCEFHSGFALNLQSEHFPNASEELDADARGTERHAEARSWGQSWAHGNKRSLRGGETASSYLDGIQRNREALPAGVAAGDGTTPPWPRASTPSRLATVPDHAGA